MKEPSNTLIPPSRDEALAARLKSCPDMIQNRQFSHRLFSHATDRRRGRVFLLKTKQKQILLPRLRDQDDMSFRSRRRGSFDAEGRGTSRERWSGRAPSFYRTACRAEAFFRQAAGGSPTWRLKARLKAYSDS